MCYVAVELVNIVIYAWKSVLCCSRISCVPAKVRSKNDTWYSQNSLFPLCKSYSQNGRLHPVKEGRKFSAAHCAPGNIVDAMGGVIIIIGRIHSHTTDRKNIHKIDVILYALHNQSIKAFK